MHLLMNIFALWSSAGLHVVKSAMLCKCRYEPYLSILIKTPFLHYAVMGLGRNVMLLQSLQ